MKPWKVLGSERLFKHIRIDRCELPDHRVYEVPVLEHKDWITVLALTKDGQVVLERQYRHGLQRILLELPAGVMHEQGETPQEAARRELLEETGYTSERFIQVGVVSPDPADHTNLVFCFLALDAEKTADQDLDDTEEIEVLLKPLDEVIALARSGELLQSLQVSALFLALAYLGRVV